MNVIRTLLVGEDRPFLETLAVRLRQEPDLEILPIAGDLRQARTVLSALSPDILLLDLSIGHDDGFRLLDEIRDGHPHCQPAVLTGAPRPDGTDKPDDAVEAVRRGARAWTAKTVPAAKLIRILHGVHNGECWIPPDILGYVLRQLVPARVVPRPDPLGSLTARERDVLQFVVDGLSKREIARRLYLSPNTVRTHIQNIMHKLSAHSIHEAISCARRYGMHPSDRGRGGRSVLTAG